MDIESLLQWDSAMLLTLNGSGSQFMDGWMATLTSGLTWIPLYVALLYLVIKNSETMMQIFIVVCCAALCVLLADGVADGIAKPTVARLRPCYDPALRDMVAVPITYHLSAKALYGFFSAHAANTFSIAVFMCLLVRSRILGITLILWSLLNCYTRLYLGVHYPLDIVCGLLWGGTVGCLVYFIYYRISRKALQSGRFVSTQYTSTGYSTDDIDIVMLVFIATIVYTVLRAVCM